MTDNNWQVEWRVTIDGKDASDRMNPYLTSIEVEDKKGKSGDTCNLEFDDTDGQCVLFQGGEHVQIELAGTEAFEGYLDTPDWTLDRGGGRRLTCKGTSYDSRGKVKDGQAWHKDDATLGEFMKEAAKRAGLDSITIDPELAKIKRDYWSPDGASFLHTGESIADEVGGVFKIKGKKAVLAKRGGGTTAGGTEMPVKQLTVGSGDTAGNVRSARIKPFTGRSNVSKVKIRHYDRDKAKWVEEDAEIERRDDKAPESVERVRYSAADKDSAEVIGKGKKAKNKEDGGAGSIVIDLDPTIVAGMKVALAGARDGIDGQFEVESARHKATRSGAAETSLEVKHPGGDAGKDKRRKGGSDADGDGE